LPEEVSVVFLGDGEYDSVELQSYLAGLRWDYVCRTAKSTLLTSLTRKAVAFVSTRATSAIRCD
jgi:hypothetical protein